VHRVVGSLESEQACARPQTAKRASRVGAMALKASTSFWSSGESLKSTGFRAASPSGGSGAASSWPRIAPRASPSRGLPVAHTLTALTWRRVHTGRAGVRACARSCMHGVYQLSFLPRDRHPGPQPRKPELLALLPKTRGTPRLQSATAGSHAIRHLGGHGQE